MTTDYIDEKAEEEGQTKDSVLKSWTVQKSLLQTAKTTKKARKKERKSIASSGLG